MKERAWLLYLGAVTLATPVYLLGPDAVNSGPVFNLIGASAIIAVALGCRMNRAHLRLPWYLLAAGQAMFVAGDILAYNYTRFFGGELPFPSIADPVYLSVYPLAVAGLLILIHQRTPSHDRASLVDSLIIAVSLGVLSWIFLIAPQAHDGSLPLPTKLTSISYPVMDLLLLGVAVRLAVGGGRRGTSFYLLVGGVAALFATDSLYGWALLHGGYETGGFLDGGWILFYALWGAAALHPSMRSLDEPAREPDQRLTPGRLALLAGATMIPPAVQIGLHLLGQPIDVLILTGSSVLLFSLVLSRMAGLVHRNEQTVAREKALREAGAALVTATSRDGIYAATMNATRALVGGQRSTLLYWFGDTEGQLDMVASAGGETACAASLEYAALPEEVRFRLGRRAVAEMRLDDQGADATNPAMGRRRMYLTPLFMRDELRGILVVVGDSSVPQTTKEALLTLALEVALALESAALTEDLLRNRSEARFRSLLEHSTDLVTLVSTDMRIVYASPSAEEMVGFRAEELEARRYSELVHSEDLTRVTAFLQTVLDRPSGHPAVIEMRLTRRDGTELDVETVATNLIDDPNLGGVVLNTRNVTERKAFERQLTHQAFHDTLTGLPNNALFRNRVEHALSAELRDGPALAVLFLDIDDFKTTNDTLGHAAGDEVLRQVGARLHDVLRGADTAARLGGDEFAILLEGLRDELRATDVAERVMGVLSAPITVEGEEISIGVSVGVAFAELDGRGAAATDDLLRHADVAMYMAKDHGKGRYQVFEPNMHALAIERLELKADLQRAVSEGEFIVHYQPIVALRSGWITGVEALVRWRHPERGTVPPNDFIPLAEETGVINSIGRMVLEEACREALILQQSCPQTPELAVSVNISARQLQRPQFPAEVRRILDDTGLAAESLVLEITESAMMEDMNLALLRLEELRALGVRLAVDDFGTGYSSLTYIRRFPLDVLKVDKSFIDELDSHDGEINALTGAIIGLAQILGLRPVAEGIETADQLRRLLELECELGQGYFFHKPMPKEDVERLVASQARLPSPGAV
jgi:diguanylate cyclase (GGDEF)-like protein/PAS domain S-box-containing protein